MILEAEAREKQLAAAKLRLRALHKAQAQGFPSAMAAAVGVSTASGAPGTTAASAAPAPRILLAIKEKGEDEASPAKRQKAGTGAALERVTTLKNVNNLIPQDDLPTVWPDAMKPEYEKVSAVYFCGVSGCNFSKSKRDSVWNHVTQTHTLKRAMCPAPNCGVCFGNPESMRTHLKKEHGQKIRFARKAEQDRA